MLERLRCVGSLVLLSLLLVAHGSTASSLQCACGYRDDTTGFLFTESIISYFNETGVDTDFVPQSYTNHAEKSWNALYRQGASPSNVVETKDDETNETLLHLIVDPPEDNHVVVGGAIRTRRQDLLYGTFRGLLRSPPRQAGGSVLTMAIEFNETESINVNLMNTDSSSNAWLSTLLDGESSSHTLGVPYQAILAAAATNSSIQSPWNFMEIRIDWTPYQVEFFVQNNMTRSVPGKHGLPQTPSPFYLRHWSTGAPSTSQGPPTNQTSAEVAWARLFFNSSLMTKEQHQIYDEQCRVTPPCSVNDWRLRNSSQYDARALISWQQLKPNSPKRIPAIIVAISSVVITTILILHSVLYRQPWKKRDVPDSEISQPEDTIPHDFCPTPRVNSTPQSYNEGRDSRSLMQASPVSPASGSIYGTTAAFRSGSPSRHTPSVAGGQSIATTLIDVTRKREHENPDVILPVPNFTGEAATGKQDTLQKAGQSLLKAAAPLPKPSPSNIPMESHPDSLTGLLVVCSMVVTTVDFALTFIPALIEPYANSHYMSEVWARKTMSSFFLTFNWIGPFLTFSGRTLAVTYLRQGSLLDIARKAVTQIPRLVIPVVAVTLIEYFLISTGITKWLEYMPSLTWSNWPFVGIYTNFANWLTDLLELVYLLPNAAPAISSHFCTGVLWIIPVQLQFSWTILLGAVVIREIKTPWKRFLYYAFAIVTSWYALSWGSFFWFGFLLADLDVTYDYKTMVSRSRWSLAATLSIFLLLILLGGGADYVAEWTNFNFSVLENNIHPDLYTALPLGRTQNGGYPAYYIPRLSSLAFTAGLHGIVEISPWVQKVLSTKPVAFFYPHYLAIYFIHGAVFWSWGSWLTITLAGNLGMPYWAVLLIVAVTSYTIIGLILPILSPVLGTLERSLTGLTWHSAVTEPPTKRKTVFPFDQRLIQEYDARGVDEKA